MAFKFLVITLLASLSLRAFCEAAVAVTVTVEEQVETDSTNIYLCRQKCYSEILHQYDANGGVWQLLRCKKRPNCFMCWDYCRALNIATPDLAQAMCGDEKFCLRGCRIACKNYRTKTLFQIIAVISEKSLKKTLNMDVSL